MYHPFSCSAVAWLPGVETENHGLLLLVVVMIAQNVFRKCFMSDQTLVTLCLSVQCRGKEVGKQYNTIQCHDKLHHELTSENVVGAPGEKSWLWMNLYFMVTNIVFPQITLFLHECIICILTLYCSFVLIKQVLFNLHYFYFITQNDIIKENKNTLYAISLSVNMTECMSNDLPQLGN